MKNFKLPKLVIFDMDGTMLDTEPISLKAMMHAGTELGVEIKIDVAESLMGKSIVRCREILRANYGENFDLDKAFEIHKDYVMSYYKENNVPIKTGIYELLDKLETMGIKKAVATSTGKQAALWKLNNAKIAHRFDVIIGGDEVENGKPSPDIFLKAAADCGTAPADCIIIEDTEAGILGATAADIRVIAVPDIAPLTEEIRAKAFVVCKDLHVVAEMFGE
ncbi:MAG: HAD family phosphatase [Defluviitaleaceae bacterium]|nr:HAD family phosphatase [Defluviitaleaceae bacterium]